MKKILITSALPYANGPLHFGHIAGAFLPADAYARFQRMQGADVLYISGSDEHGVAITLSAESAKKTPKQHVDHFHKINEAFFQKLHISFDHYSRTTWEGHVGPTQAFFKDLLANEYIEEKITNQLFSNEEGRFLADRYVLGTCPKCGFLDARGDECTSCGANYEATDLINPRSKITGSKLCLKPTKHWFIRFDQFKERLSKWLETKDWKPSVVNFVKNYIDELRPRAITRDSDWGIPVPLDGAEGKVFYVWFDAPIGYISATKQWALKKKDPDAWKNYWLDESVKYVQFIGKDNIPFHAIFFPAMVMGQNTPYKLVDELPANEFYNLEGRQFSKSAGWTIDLESFFTQFSVDQIRYCIAANAPETQDSEFTWKDFQLRCNSELLGKYGNFANRTLVFAQNNTNGKIPPLQDLAQEDHLFLEKVKEIAADINNSYENFQLRKAASQIMELASAGNVYFDTKKPWKTIKTEKQDAFNAIGCSLYALQILAMISFPIIPETAEKLWNLLGLKNISKTSWSLENQLEANKSLEKPTILFHKVEDEIIEKEIAKLKDLETSVKTGEYPKMKDQVTFDLFQKLDLRVGKIIHAEKVPKSSKLLKLTVDLGFEKRTIVSGIAKSFSDFEALIGQKVTVVANLKPATLMGIVSEGLILSAESPEGLELVQAVNTPSGNAIS